MGVVTGVVVAGAAAYGGYQSWKASEDAKDRAEEQRRAQEAYEQANREYGRKMYTIQKKKLNQQRQDANFAWRQAQDAAEIAREEAEETLDLAEENYLDSMTQLERSRQDARMDIVQQRRSATNAAAAFGGRGGSTFESVDRRAGEASEDVEFTARMERRNATRQIHGVRNRIDTSLQRIDEGLESAEQGYLSAISTIRLNRKAADASYRQSQAGLEYQATMNDIQLDSVYDATQYSWLTGTLQGLQTGFQLVSGGMQIAPLFSNGIGGGGGTQWGGPTGGRYGYTYPY